MPLLLAPGSVLYGQEHPHGPPGQHPGTGHAAGPMAPGPLGIPRTRESSGTAWLPDFSPMYAMHAMAGPWQLMLHGRVFAQYIDEGSDRGAVQPGSVNWIMGMARRPLVGGELLLRAMLSLEPLTVGECGYPDLLATGEFCDDRGRLHDRQHPHDFSMELAAGYERALTRDLGLQLYGGLAGEPALGPVSYPHRISALANLFAPITHHWQDATHISFGVLTAGLFGRRWKLEGSLFNGREPDEERFGLDLAALDSYSGRVWYLPGDRWALQASIGRLNEAEAHGPEERRLDVTRATASVTYHAPIGPDGYWASTAVWGRNDADGDPASTNSFLLETTVDLRERYVFFGRGEVVEKTGEDLVLRNPALEHEVFTVGKLTLGYMHQFGPRWGLLPGLGVSISMSFVGDELEPFYGTTVPVGFALFGSLGPAAARLHGDHHRTVPPAHRPEGHPPHGPAAPAAGPAGACAGGGTHFAVGGGSCVRRSGR
ncbi:MAG TPA: hypothetical protein VIL13_12195 [Longimicrobiales bacterium]